VIIIIKEGTRPSEREWKFNCANCGTIFECLQGEGLFYSDQRDGDVLTYVCPTCDRTCYGRLK
jgi:predicted RNA-binding Zn-ribbon protein involved in translation (DUF1610 family)